MQEMDSTEVAFVLIVTVLGVCALGLLLWKLFRRLNQASQILL